MKEKYIDHVPRKPNADGLILVHNHVEPQPVNRNGFRIWLAEPADEYEVCPCGWAKHLPVHYRVKKPA